MLRQAVQPTSRRVLHPVEIRSRPGLWRLRVGEWRVIFNRRDADRVIDVLAIGLAVGRIDRTRHGLMELGGFEPPTSWVR
jgi:mRNA-degrading endonuclease RelE of RelBE toxin-antitoxin system